MSTLLKRGMKGDEVLSLQKQLVALGYSLKPDGIYGKDTFDAVWAFQTKQGLGVDGIAGKDTQAAIVKLAKPTATSGLTEEDFKWAANYLGVEVAAIKAVRDVESPKGGYLPDGRVTILYERHQMYRQLKKHGINPDAYVTSNPDIVNKTMGGYLGGASEYTRLDKAKKIDVQSALESCSWGAYQIMGYHWVPLGYTSVNDFVSAMELSERGQLEVFVNFIKKVDPRLNRALKDKNWTKFAEYYNGPAYAKNEYDKKMLNAYNRYS